MTIRCPKCQTLYRVEPEQVRATTRQARCGRCAEVFPIARETTGPGIAPVEQILPEKQSDQAPAADMASAYAEAAMAPMVASGSASDSAPAAVETAVATPGSAAATAPNTPAAPEATAGASVHFFGPQDPHQRARHLARALVSDIIAYYPDRIERSRAAGTLKEEFREEILKSWEEFVLQVGSEFARETDHFQAALNEILARGEQVF